MKKIMTNLGNLLNTFKHRTRVTPSLLGKSITIYAHGQVLVVGAKDLQVRTNGNSVVISHAISGTQQFRVIELGADDLASANNLLRRIYLAASPLYLRAIRFSVIVVVLAMVISAFSGDETATQAPLDSAALQSPYMPTIPQPVMPVAPSVSAADEMGLPPAPFID